MHIDDLDTPFLMVDLDALEENLDRYQQYFDRHGIAALVQDLAFDDLDAPVRRLNGAHMPTP